MDILPDILAHGLRVVFCGTAVGNHSASRGAYYAGPGNKFWTILFQIGLTPHLLKPEEFPSVVQYGIGMTDLVKTSFGADDTLSAANFDKEGLAAKIRKYSPKCLAFNGKTAAKAFYDVNHVDYGCQSELIDRTAVFVMPSTSGAARGYWDESVWLALADFIRKA